MATYRISKYTNTYKNGNQDIFYVVEERFLFFWWSRVDAFTTISSKVKTLFTDISLAIQFKKDLEENDIDNLPYMTPVFICKECPVLWKNFRYCSNSYWGEYDIVKDMVISRMELEHGKKIKSVKKEVVSINDEIASETKEVVSL